MKSFFYVFVILVLAGCQTAGTQGSTGQSGSVSASTSSGAGSKFPQRHTVSESTYVVTGTSDIEIVYIGASDCPPCRVFKNVHYPKWVASPEYQHVTYRELEFASFRSTTSSYVWPDDLKWLLKATVARSGAPRWIVLLDGEIISNERSWTGRAQPLIKSLVAKKLSA